MFCDHRTVAEAIYLKIYFTFMSPAEPIDENPDMQNSFKATEGLPTPIDNEYLPDDA